MDDSFGISGVSPSSASIPLPRIPWVGWEEATGASPSVSTSRTGKESLMKQRRNPTFHCLVSGKLGVSMVRKAKPVQCGMEESGRIITKTKRWGSSRHTEQRSMTADGTLRTLTRGTTCFTLSRPLDLNMMNSTFGGPTDKERDVEGDPNTVFLSTTSCVAASPALFAQRTREGKLDRRSLQCRVLLSKRWNLIHEGSRTRQTARALITPTLERKAIAI